MSYWFGINCDNLLFEGFTITTTPGKYLLKMNQKSITKVHPRLIFVYAT